RLQRLDRDLAVFIGFGMQVRAVGRQNANLVDQMGEAANIEGAEPGAEKIDLIPCISAVVVAEKAVAVDDLRLHAEPEGPLHQTAVERRPCFMVMEIETLFIALRRCLGDTLIGEGGVSRNAAIAASELRRYPAAVTQDHKLSC